MVAEKNVQQEIASIKNAIAKHESEIYYLRGMLTVLSNLTTDTIFVNVPDEIKATVKEA